MAFTGFVKVINILFFGLHQVQLQTYSTSTKYSASTANPCIFHDCDQMCAIVSGKAECQCLLGKLQADNKTCVIDYNPCLINRGGCSQLCGLYLGKAVCSCFFGKLQPDGKTCKQDFSDPCFFNRGGCDQICERDSGKAVCSCYFGKLQPDGKTCKEDPCLFNGCEQLCSVVSGKAVCSCFAGILEPNNKTCKRDPCEFNGGCEEICLNILGKAVCSCFAGNLKLDGMSCTKDPCAFNGGCSQQCRVVFGKAVCSCYNGKLNSNGKTCDKDPCIKKGCSHNCYKIKDSIMCSCPPGMDLQPNELVCLKSDTGSSQTIGGLKSIGVIICGTIVMICYIINYQRKRKLERTSAQASSDMQGPSTDMVVPHIFETQNSDIEQPALNRHDYLNEDLGVINMANTSNCPPPYDIVDLHPPPSYESTQFSNSLTVISSNERPPMYSE
ncbi:matrilin-2-like isoform X3 [Hydra vulgaris]|uniref:Matrilin-2-like isoform X3 n=1 Tax=Hydra vulgaris TaxID=6087 RepID=A0ABM4BMB8_HYDVU